MKQKLITLITISFLLTTCNYNSNQDSSSNQTGENSISFPISFYKKFKGKIGNESIVMDLFKKDSIFSGKYYFTKIGVPISINGHINSDGNFKLSEINVRQDATCIFSGLFTNEKSMAGVCTNSMTNKALTFNLSETENIATLSFESKHSENCKNAERNKKHPTADLMYLDTLCTTLDLDLIKVMLPSKQLTQRINKTIEGIIGEYSYDEKKYISIDALMNSVNSVENNNGFAQSIRCDLVTNTNDILCLRIGQSICGFGAAHPSSVWNFYNFNLKTGEQILLEDLLLPNYEKTMNQVAEKKFVEAHGSDGWNFEKGNFKLNKDFAITPGGLLFSFDQYEIGAYVMGSPEVFIPYTDIQNLIKPDGVLKLLQKR